MKRRILPMFMSVMMILSIIQMPAWAATGDDPAGEDGNPGQVSEQPVEESAEPSAPVEEEPASNELPSLPDGETEEEPAPEERADKVAEVNGDKFTTLQAAIDEANGAEITLLADVKDCTEITLSQGETVNINLNGHDIGFAQGGYFCIRHGTLNLTGNGEVYEQRPYYGAVLMKGGAEDVSNYSVVTVGENVTLRGWAGLFIDKNNNDNYGIVANVYGTLKSVKDTSGAGGHALYVNGTIKATEGNVPKLTLDGATLNTEAGNGMYLAGYAETSIRNSTITSSSEGSTGIEIRAGKLTITGSTVTGGSGEYEGGPNGNGSTSSNVALAVVQHTTKLPLEVTVNGGTFSGGAAFVQADEQDNGEDAVKKIKIDIQAGKFEGQVYSENVENFISGGTFSGDVSDYLADGVDLIANSDGTYSVGAVTAENAAAQVGDNYYGTLEEAIAAAAEASDHTILLLNDVKESITIAGSTTIVLDLNGHTITNTADQHTITNNGTLTVQDSSTSQTGTVDNVTHAKGALVNYGTATLKGGTFTRSKEASTSPSDSGGNSWYVIDNHGTMTIDGATVTSTGKYSSLIRNIKEKDGETGKLTVSSGNLSNGFITLKNDDGGTLEVTGGTITSGNQAVQNWYNANISGGIFNGSVITWSYEGQASTTTISGDAQITGDVVAVNYDNSGSTPTVNIKGGTVIGQLRKGRYNEGIVDQDPDATTSEIKVTGGSFSESVNENYLADTLNAELIRADSSAPYSYYSSVAEAQKAAGDEDIVVDLSQSTGEGNETVQVTLNFNGNGTANKSYSVMKGVTIVLPTPRRSGYTFEGWYDGDTRVSNPYKVTKAVTLTAEWDYKDDDHGSGSGSSSSSSSSSVRRYNIEADAGRGGDISPDGRVRVRRGENQTFRITADDGWEIADVEVDGESVGAVERYTFENVRTDHTISATFRQIDAEPETPELPFTDVAEGDWYYDAVAYCWENGIMDGTSGTVFAPNLLLNRAMMAQVLYNLADGTASTVAGFPDVAASAWYADAVNWAAANGYVTGYDNGGYGPEDSLTREQLAVILYRYAGSPAPAGTLDGFADAASASDYAVDALRWAVGEGLLTGKDGGRLDPTGTASRAELAQILARFAQM